MKPPPVGYVYLLHFDEPLHHAQHYIGCTKDLQGRLWTHASGNGARIIRAALLEGINFELGALGTTNCTAMRRVERQVKNWHNASEFCEICNNAARKMPGTTPYPIACIDFATKSVDIQLRRSLRDTEPVLRLTSGSDNLKLVETLKQLMSYDKDALGFIPAGGDTGISISMVQGRVIVAEIGTEVVGYLLFTSPLSITKPVKIHQTVVVDAYRGCGIGRKMVEFLANLFPEQGMQAKVRDTLIAVGFWAQVGFKEVGSDTHETSGQKLIIFRKEAKLCSM